MLFRTEDVEKHVCQGGLPQGSCLTGVRNLRCLEKSSALWFSMFVNINVMKISVIRYFDIFVM